MIAAGKHTIDTVGGNVRDWNSAKGGPMKSYRVTFLGDDLTYELSRKAASEPPAPGQQLDVASVELNGDYPPKIRLAFGGGGRGGRTPEENARIVRQHSQEMALRYAAIKASVGELPKDFKPSDLFKLADHFDADAKAAKP